MKRSKLVLASVLAAVAVGAGFFAVSVTAAPPTMIETTYFSDATHSTQVGYRIRLCTGRTVTSGKVTSFTEVSSESCYR
ncbi:MAG: hypothetical protein E6Q34_09840 [Burkholderiaceae bacterium]|nr:MAG: hypothetical protein E6Q34_09840 [Burkholderiaceae bacterium]